MNVIRISRPALSGIFAAGSLALAAFSPFATADEMTIKLSGAKEVPPVATQASGKGSITVKKDMTISGKVTTVGITPSMAHIHQGKPDDNGPAIIALDQIGDNTWGVPEGTRLDESEFRAYLAGELYVNVHTAEHKDGEIRGQLIPGKAMTNGR